MLDITYIEELYKDALNNPDKYRSWIDIHYGGELSTPYRAGLVLTDGWTSNLKGKVITFKTTTVETLYVILNAFSIKSLRLTRIIKTKTKGIRCEFLVKVVDEECSTLVKSLLNNCQIVLRELSKEDLVDLLAGIFDGDGIATRKYIAISVKPEVSRKGRIVYEITTYILDNFSVHYHKSYERVYISVKDLRAKMPTLYDKVHHPRRKTMLAWHLFRISA